MENALNVVGSSLAPYKMQVKKYLALWQLHNLNIVRCWEGGNYLELLTKFETSTSLASIRPLK